MKLDKRNRTWANRRQTMDQRQLTCPNAEVQTTKKETQKDHEKEKNFEEDHGEHYQWFSGRRTFLSTFTQPLINDCLESPLSLRKVNEELYVHASITRDEGVEVNEAWLL
ncbi:hypothetical protein M514_21381 [Trichuris suis]|uniref:Uncharacterized protein n=1 Tax=Trichuris suis TaxID=68888 RepID=A0A085M7S5_9BILA|nr:hypothetical protein M513_05751 [Trichuris suis]KFD53271.1 hypothetical protein M513_05752 [Trichuris suis]KFD66350.1 hypothetical protein M514_21380 [Trichuris suis]KFD66351.1 hypothetical protein M514_21381 [Trichuris suis]